MKVTHICEDIHAWTERWTEQDASGYPIPCEYDIAIERTYCGKEDYAGTIPMAWADPTEATCQECRDLYAMGLLAETWTDPGEW